MKQHAWIAVAAVLLVVCIFQQAQIMRQVSSTPVQKEAAPPDVAMDPKALAAKLTVFPGAKDLHGLDGTRYGSGDSGGFDGCLWLDVSEAPFQEAERERRIAEIGWHYARQIAAAIPGAQVNRALDGPNLCEAGSLRSTYVVGFPSGFIVISAAYREGKDGKVSDTVKLHIISLVGSQEFMSASTVSRETS